MKLSRYKIEFTWHVMAFILLSGAFVPLWRQISNGGIDPENGDPVQRVFLIVAYLGVGLLVFQPRRATIMALKSPLLWLLVGWVLLSTLWSVAPGITLRRGVAVLLATLYGLLLAVRYRPRTVLQMLGVSLAIMMLVSILAVLIFPEWAIMGSSQHGAWQGVFTHKNILGRTTVLALIVFWTLYQGEKDGKNAIWLFLILISTILLIEARSATSMISIIVLVLALPFLWLVLQLPSLLKPALISLGMAIAVLTIVILPNYLETILAFFGKNLTLTGRVALWQTLFDASLKKPYLGYGYGAFWGGASSPSASAISLLSWVPTHAHNGFLDLWLDMGLIGLSLSIILTIWVLFKSGKQAMRSEKEPFSQFFFVFTMFIFLSNVTYSTLLEGRLGTAMYWIILVYYMIFGHSFGGFQLKFVRGKK